MIRKGDTVSIQYEIRLKNGEVVEATSPSEPEQFVFGAGDFSEFIEQRIQKLKAGEMLTFEISPEDHAFGYYNAEDIHQVPRGAFSQIEIAEGNLVDFELPSGELVSGRIESVSEESVRVDFNNPLIGRELNCQLRLLAIEPPEAKR